MLIYLEYLNIFVIVLISNKPHYLRKECFAMAIGERIHFFRPLRGMTQKYLGVRLGFDEKSADVRIAQYESGTRSPKDNYIALLADTLGGCHPSRYPSLT